MLIEIVSGGPCDSGAPTPETRTLYKGRVLVEALSLRLDLERKQGTRWAYVLIEGQVRCDTKAEIASLLDADIILEPWEALGTTQHVRRSAKSGMVRVSLTLNSANVWASSLWYPIIDLGTGKAVYGDPHLYLEVAKKNADTTAREAGYILRG